MCSTPFGINGRNTPPWRPPKTTTSVLNAFRHQRKEHQQQEPEYDGLVCAQRLSASTEGTHSPPSRSDRSPECSTPFGINGRNTTGSIAEMSAFMCSTPFGINGRNTLSRRPTLLPPVCAQRLSASTEGTHIDLPETKTAAACAQRLSASTEGTRRCLPRTASGREVLNAFRHQRKEHPGESSHDRSRSSVLNAFRHQRKEHRHLCRRLHCDVLGAQRLSASTEGTRKVCVSRLDWQLVLNAFRHQRKEHATSGTSCRTELVVLNAFRHQRKEHARNPSAIFRAPMCSTPFGINGRNTSRGQAAQPQA